MLKTTGAAVIAAFAVVVALFGVHPGSASSSGGDPRIPALQRQVKALTAQVKTLQARVADDEGQTSVSFEGSTCVLAQVADLLQGTWSVIDQMAQALQQKTYFGAQTAVDDFGNCGDLAQPAVPRPGITVPPTVEPLRPLAEWLHVS